MTTPHLTEHGVTLAPAGNGVARVTWSPELQAEGFEAASTAVRRQVELALGDLKQKLAVDAKGEIAALADTINGMIDTLKTFADQVTTVAREVGVEGKLGGQASVPGAAGFHEFRMRTGMFRSTAGRIVLG